MQKRFGFIFLVVLTVHFGGCLTGRPVKTQGATPHPLVGTWNLAKGRRPPGQIQFQADQYFKQMVLHPDGHLELVRDIGTRTEGTWLYDAEAEALFLKYKGGHDAAGFAARKTLDVFSHIKLEGDTLTFPDLGSQEMIYQRSPKDD